MDLLKLICFLIIMLGSVSLYASDQPPFPGKFAPDKVPIGSVFIYSKSNLDGSHASNIAVYYHNALEITSFKWTEGNTHGTLVHARLSPKTLNVAEFSAASMNANGQQIPRAKLSKQQDGQFSVQLGEHITQKSISSANWHSYDFDFASLAFAYPHLADPEKDYQFDILDLDMQQNPPPFKKMGQVLMQFKEAKPYNGKQARGYTIDGSGLDNRGGTIWFERDSGTMLGFEIAKPDESGYHSNKLVLQKIEQFSEQQWQSFMISSLNP